MEICHFLSWILVRRRSLPTEYRRESYKYERDRNKMVWSSFLENDVTKRKKKSTVAKVSRLRVPLGFSFLSRQVVFQKSCSKVLRWSVGLSLPLKCIKISEFLLYFSKIFQKTQIQGVDLKLNWNYIEIKFKLNCDQIDITLHYIWN